LSLSIYLYIKSDIALSHVTDGLSYKLNVHSSLENMPCSCTKKCWVSQKRLSLLNMRGSWRFRF